MPVALRVLPGAGFGIGSDTRGVGRLRIGGVRVVACGREATSKRIISSRHAAGYDRVERPIIERSPSTARRSGHADLYRGRSPD